MTEPQDSKSKSKARYSQFAQGYVTSQTHAKGDDLERLVEIAQPQPEWEMLDVATGGGHTALKFASHVRHVWATDLTPKMLQAAEKHLRGKGIENVNFKLADAEDLPFANGTFDMVTCRIAPHHFPDCARFVREGARVLKSGGLLLVQDHVLPEDAEAARYVDDFERLRDPSHNRAFARGEWMKMFTAAGLQVEHTEEIVKRHQLIPWAERQGNSAQIIAQLVELLKHAPTAAASWLQAENVGTPDANFVNHHILIAGRKPI
ncbi:MAG: class I SAM-dependent methyltransferase [Anaerolineales bacterium]|nr:class I SAM-dependent methyltransferase [Anaerolineales bacterium]